MVSTEKKEYEEQLERYLEEGVDWYSNPIKNANKGDLEQLAADSFWTGWHKAKEYYFNLFERRL